MKNEIEVKQNQLDVAWKKNEELDNKLYDTNQLLLAKNDWLSIADSDRAYLRNEVDSLNKKIGELNKMRVRNVTVAQT